MSSYASIPVRTQNFSSHQQTLAHDYDTYLPTPQSSFPVDIDFANYEPRLFSQTLALLQQQQNQESHSGNCMSDYVDAPNPNIRIETSTPTPLPPAYDARQDSVISASVPIDWQQMFPMSMGGPVATPHHHRPLKRARTHQRTPSTSTVASTGPASPYTANTSYPQIANTDYSPKSPAPFADQPLFSKNLPTPQQTPTEGSFLNCGYIPSQYARTPTAHLAMKDFAINHHIAEDFPPEFYQSSRQSMSSHGNDSPATPQSGACDSADTRNYNLTQNGENALAMVDVENDCLLFDDTDYRQTNSDVQLFRTESQAYQDELYNPSVFTSTPISALKRRSEYLSPHRKLVTERLQTAHLARSASPASAVSRERSPFRDNSPLAPAGDWRSTGQAVGTAAGMRQQQKEEAEQVEYAQHRPQLQREPTKTISPQDAMLDYTEPDQPSLFQDNIPAGYRQHTGGSEPWQPNFSSAGSFGNLTASAPSQHQQMAPFRATLADEFATQQFGFTNLPPTHYDQATQIQHAPFQGNSYMPSKMAYSDSTPEFPATLTSMESSVSESGPPVSSQDSFHDTSTPQRPTDTRANTGTYTCTYHGCTERFDSHNNLQKHKRDFHRSQQNRETMSTSTDSTSPRSTESPAPSTSGMTSAAILARNSQAGPHKCTRINPSTNKPCNTIFSRPYDLTRHEDTIHNNRKQKVRCPMCREEKTFSRNDALTRHMRVVHPEVETFGKRGRRGD